MRLSDLLKERVVDADGEDVGQVHDVRLVKDGPVQGAFGPAYRVQGLVVGGSAWGVRLGFDRTDVKGPWVLKVFFRRLHRGSRFVEWAQVRSVEHGVIRLKAARHDLPPVPTLRH